jgi:UDP-N-acetylmuramate dehydrogenase
MLSHFKEELRRITRGRAVFDMPLSRLTTLGVGGPAWAWIAPESFDELKRLVESISVHRIPYFIVGKGSNLLVSDRGYAGVMLSLERGFSSLTFKEGPTGAMAEVGAGASLKAVLAQCMKLGYGGLEFTAGIPGTVGGAIIMNAGTCGGEMRDVVRWVEGLTSSAKQLTLSHNDLCFEYRRLRLEEGFIITKTGFELKNRTVTEVKALVRQFLRKRASQPKEKHSAGSIFKNPEGYYAGKLIEEAGFKGYREGGAKISESHANWIVTNGQAKGDDVFVIIRRVQEAVKVKFGVTLEPEVTLLGFNHL